MPNFVSDFIEYLRWQHTRFEEQRIERRYRIETSVPETKYLNNVESANREHAVPYEPIQLDVFKAMIRRLKRVISAPHEFTFIDLGSGKGRALIYAAEAGFKRCVGVEFSKELHDTALVNIESYSSISDTKCQISLSCTDAAEYTFPNNDIVLFLYNPFGIEVMKSVLNKIDRFAEFTCNEMYILYRNPICAEDFGLHHLELLDSHRSFKIFRVSR